MPWSVIQDLRNFSRIVFVINLRDSPPGKEILFTKAGMADPFLQKTLAMFRNPQLSEPWNLNPGG
jgi:hypothetical protein